MCKIDSVKFPRKSRESYIRKNIVPLLNALTKQSLLIIDAPDLKDHYVFARGDDPGQFFYIAGKAMGELYKEYLRESRPNVEGELELPLAMFLKGMAGELVTKPNPETIKSGAGYILNQVFERKRGI